MAETHPAFRRETARLVLRDWRDDDWAPFFRRTNTQTVMRWLGGPLDQAGRDLQRQRVANCQARNGFCFWLVERHDDGGHLSGEVMGFCGIKRADAPGSTITDAFEIGWRFREDSWGLGYAREAASAALDVAFGQFGADEVFAITVIGNRPSWGLMKRLGMQRRTDCDYQDQRFTGPMRDQIVYSIDRAGWEAPLD